MTTETRPINELENGYVFGDSEINYVGVINIMDNIDLKEVLFEVNDNVTSFTLNKKDVLALARFFQLIK